TRSSKQCGGRGLGGGRREYGGGSVRAGESALASGVSDWEDSGRRCELDQPSEDLARREVDCVCRSSKCDWRRRGLGCGYRLGWQGQGEDTFFGMDRIAGDRLVP